MPRATAQKKKTKRERERREERERENNPLIWGLYHLLLGLSRPSKGGIGGIGQRKTVYYIINNFEERQRKKRRNMSDLTAASLFQARCIDS